MKLLRGLFNPVFAFVGLQILWVLVLLGWINWFMGRHQQLRELAERYSPELAGSQIDWVILVEGILLLVAILAAAYVIFIYWRRQIALNRAQRNFIAQVTHELKSPLSSLQLHIETLRRHRVDPERLATFLDTMQADVKRLDILTSNLLTVNRLEHKGLKLALKPGNFSALTESYFKDIMYALPRAGHMTLDIEPDLHAHFEAESMRTVFRNLLENALLYSEGTPQLHVSLKREGTRLHFAFRDNGCGLARDELRKVFKMFYRVQGTGKTIRGSGLGLFIVRAIVRMHKGKVWLESPGPGKGTTAHVLLPAWKGPVPSGEEMG
ncbi:histidine kinase [Geothermobacter ehrlichii]|uniref:histidine kinase n=1 Tax=Geothermobacter ehrlichii TaxID=213224 RepID=A0A5D3WLJ2_9BACT|nr:HAMP domain-containing sensor histidine kinase [Geothermobacter ehrlichii]TYO99004.1 histidine kinase [Geothermobacter ehrlichii]